MVKQSATRPPWQPGAVPNTYASRVQLRGVLFPLMGWLRPKPGVAHDKVIREKVRVLRRMWFGRVDKLGDLGWPPAARSHNDWERKRSYLKFCLPTFCLPAETSSSWFSMCSKDSICPFCYARWLRKIWMRFDYAMFGHEITEGSGAKRGRATAVSVAAEEQPDDSKLYDVVQGRPARYDLLWQTEVRVFDGSPSDVSLHDYLEICVLDDWPAIAKRPDVLGGVQSIVVVPGENAGELRAIKRWLLTMPPNSVAANTLRGDKADNLWGGILVTPKRREVMEQVAKELRYPTELMRAPAEAVVPALAAKTTAIRRGRPVIRRTVSCCGTIGAASKFLDKAEKTKKQR